jgi:hypothetical protein
MVNEAGKNEFEAHVHLSMLYEAGKNWNQNIS